MKTSSGKIRSCLKFHPKLKWNLDQKFLRFEKRVTNILPSTTTKGQYYHFCGLLHPARIRIYRHPQNAARKAVLTEFPTNQKQGGLKIWDSLFSWKFQHSFPGSPDKLLGAYLYWYPECFMVLLSLEIISWLFLCLIALGDIHPSAEAPQNALFTT